MNPRIVKPLVLAVSIGTVLAACQKAETPAPAAPAEAPKPAAAATPAIDLATLKTPVIAFKPSDLDASTSACTDLNAYVNGTWLAANPVPSDRTTWGSFEALSERSLELQQQIADAALARADANGVEKLVGDFYAAGLNAEAINSAGIAPIQPLLDKIAAIDTPAAVTAYVREAYAQGRGMLFSFGGNADYKNSEMVIAYAGQGGLSLPERAYYLEDREDYQKARTAFVDHVKKTLTLAGIDAAAAATQADAVLALETRLAKASLPRVELRDPAKRYQPTTLEQADALTPNFSWTALFDAVGVEKPSMFSLAMQGFFTEVNTMLADTPVETWQAYLRFHEIDSAAPYLGDALADQNFAFYSQALRGQAEQQPRWKRVLNTLNGSIGEALGQLYVKVAFPPESKTKMEQLVGNLSTALKHRLENLTWMGDQTKVKALEKWASFTPKIGYPDKWRDWTGLSFSRDSYAGNVLAATAFNARYRFSKIGKPVDRAEWFMSPQTVNAYYNSTRNEIVFPAGILQPPFFDPKADDALNYGGIVAVIGHEMIHGYDDQGSKFDAKGNFDNWWTDADRAGFEQRTAKLGAQFDAYESIDGIHVNGKLTMGENIADLGGLSVAYDAMKRAQGEGFSDPKIDGFTQDQRFFFNWATVWRRNFTPAELKVRLTTDSHAPANFRAIGAPSNLPTFAAAFDCKAGDAMVRPDDVRVVIW
ncbi:M13 family metallopeptidase [Dokdonella koreensis]|uniref:Metallopeptidase n=1 Tax=Dokdonella koreensis DS-123 TaxID=1300342 RepID=A0A160DV86_9GAMM|nr:M13-type metalloendopeptidase [Dokdonella koreensis]ANB18001.1 Metallopeptidase [Dokdonella koreensis DS-123]